MRQALSFTKKFRCSKIIVKNDNSRVINRLSDGRINNSYLNDIIEDCHLLASNFGKQEIELHKVLRS